MIEIIYLDNGLKTAHLEDLEKIKGKPIWIDIFKITPEQGEIIRKAFDLHPVTIEDLDSPMSRIKIEEFPNYLFSVFYGIRRNKKGYKLAEFDFILGDNLLISSHILEEQAFRWLKTDPQKLEVLMKKGLNTCSTSSLTAK
jgi:magnesium transporter